MYVWQSINVERERGPLFKSLFPHSCSVRVPGHVSLSQERIVEPAATEVSISCLIEHTRSDADGRPMLLRRSRTACMPCRAAPRTHRDRD
jgi:hypothetical protein